MTATGNDICMCRSKNCLSHLQCHRFTAEPKTQGQSYANFYCHKGEDKCTHFMDNRPSDQPDVANIPAESQ